MATLTECNRGQVKEKTTTMHGAEKEKRNKPREGDSKEQTRRRAGEKSILPPADKNRHAGENTMRSRHASHYRGYMSR
ncbi:unnamed protein product [Calypogeia fissa]